MDDLAEISSLVLELSDLEVALYLCLAAREHCRIDATADSINDVATELALVTCFLVYKVLHSSPTNVPPDMCTHLWPYLYYR